MLPGISCGYIEKGRLKMCFQTAFGLFYRRLTQL